MAKPRRGHSNSCEHPRFLMKKGNEMMETEKDFREFTHTVGVVEDMSRIMMRYFGPTDTVFIISSLVFSLKNIDLQLKNDRENKTLTKSSKDGEVVLVKFISLLPDELKKEYLRALRYEGIELTIKTETSHAEDCDCLDTVHEEKALH